MFNIYNSDYLTQILTDMQLHGLSPQSSDVLCADGEIHRYRVIGDAAGTKNGWCAIFNNCSGVVCTYGSWKTGAKYVWCSANRNELGYEANAVISKQINMAKIKFNMQKSKEQRAASERALNLWNSFCPADPLHPYLIRKRVAPFTARQTGHDLVLPIVDCDNKLWSLQYIDSTGRKLLFTGGAKKGNFIPVHGCLSSEKIGIAEGFATAATIAKQYPHMCVIAAIDAGNLEHVALAIRNKYPSVGIGVFGDDDKLTEGNPGATKARNAAVTAGAQLYMPPWPFGAPHLLSDFNDLACWLEDKSKEMENDE